MQRTSLRAKRAPRNTTPARRTAPRPSVDERSLPSGRTLVIRSTAGGDEIELRSPEGRLEVTIACTPDGPVVRVEAARLEVKADDVSFDAAKLSMKTTGDLHLASDAEVRVTGKVIRLN